MPAVSRDFRFDYFLIRVKKLLRKPRVKRILVVCTPDFQPMLWGGAEAIRTQLQRLNEAGKDVWFYANDYRPLQLYLAAELQDKICAGFGTSREELNRLQNGFILPAFEAESSHWINEVKTLDRLEAEWKEEKYSTLSLKKPGRAYISPRETNARHSPRNLSIRRKKLAVLVFEGAIIDGKSKQHPLLGQALGAESFVPHILTLEKDKSVKGVVLRVNSGGGSASASLSITRR
jgi:protease-4